MKPLKLIKKIGMYIIWLYLAMCALILLAELMDNIVHPSPKSGVTNRKPKKEKPKKEKKWKILK